MSQDIATILFSKRTSCDAGDLKVIHQPLVNIGIQSRFTSSQLKVFHSLCLFYKAYPASRAIFDAAHEGLQHIADYLNAHTPLLERLENSGINPSQLSGQWSYAFTRWLSATRPDIVSLVTIGETGQTMADVFLQLLPDTLTEDLRSARVDAMPWMLDFKGKKKNLLVLMLEFFEKSEKTTKELEHYWSLLQVFTRFSPHTENKGEIPYSIFIHKKFKKQADIGTGQQKTISEIILSPDQKEIIVGQSRMALACYLRETDPLTHAEVKQSRFFDLGRGLQVVLCCMAPEIRQTIDSYVGYMAFKNGVPVAYGGGWVLLEGCRIGINVFPPFRGGESMYIFQQIMNLYQNIFRISRFYADPYQIGKGNSDGIRSGAFWTYYKLGFVPLQAELANMAKEEFKLLYHTRGYRTSSAILRKLASSRMIKSLDNTLNTPAFDAGDLAVAARALNKKWQKKMDGDLNSDSLSLATHRDDNTEIDRNWAYLLCEETAGKKMKSLKAAINQALKIRVNKDEWSYIDFLKENKVISDYLNLFICNYGPTDQV
ncbi:MAG: hypothetical protein IPN29_06210 [Saprospiraceae bacterium]|nr:hypothetical protein [Saprospiraceae bacterium]